jgi:transcriptional regulator with XRE-family HTH domain
MKKTLTKADLRLIGVRIYEVRQVLGMTMLELAEECGVSDYAVRHTERGDYSDAWKMREIFMGLGLRVGVILLPAPKWDLFLEELRKREEMGDRQSCGVWG